jgi:hypothetical protein
MHCEWARAQGSREYWAKASTMDELKKHYSEQMLIHIISPVLN